MAPWPFDSRAMYSQYVLALPTGGRAFNSVVSRLQAKASTAVDCFQHTGALCTAATAGLVLQRSLECRRAAPPRCCI